jgi:glycerol-3-phosphate acyltransferase PlsY
MNDSLRIALIVLGSYGIGSVSFAVVMSRLFALPDPHSYGSGNPGATNVLRTGHRAAAAFTLLGDAGKGVVAVLLARWLWPDPEYTGWTVPMAALAAFIGHLYPIFHRFQGGKGVATAAGIYLALNPWLGAGVLSTWLIMAVFFRISSLAALVAATSAPLYAAMLFGGRPVTLAIIPVTLFLLLRHRENIRRLWAGTEPRIGQKKSSHSVVSPDQSQEGKSS